MKAYLEMNQGSRQPLMECERFFKAKVLENYYSKFHMDYYHFCQQCKDHFETAGITKANQTSLTAFFLCGNINIYWTKYKHRYQSKEFTSISQTEFKAFLQKNLRKSKSFVNSIWKKLKRNSQYQLNKVYNWASQFKHLQSILLEFDSVAVLMEVTLIRYFEEGLKPFIKAKMDQNNSKLVDYEKLIAKAIKVKAKTGLWLRFYMQEIDLNYLQGNQPAHTIAHKV